jgi:predicted nucleic-acid-binding protein
VIGLDTNVLVRYLTQDDPAQSLKAVQAIESAVGQHETLFITAVVVCELVWVLEGAYGYSRTDIADALEKILRTGQFVFDDKEALWQAFEDYQRGKGDLSDHLVGRIGHKAGCAHTLTFDKGLKNNRLFRLL